MAVKIRLKRIGKKKQPFYRVVVADSRFPRDGRNIEQIGYFNPMRDPEELKVDEEKAKLWLSRGAKCSDRVAHIFFKLGLIEKSGLPVRPSKPPKAAAEAGAETQA